MLLSDVLTEPDKLARGCGKKRQAGMPQWALLAAADDSFCSGSAGLAAAAD